MTEDEELTYIIFLQFCPLTIAHEFISELNSSKQKQFIAKIRNLNANQVGFLRSTD